jgi:hypothetical protein
MDIINYEADKQAGTITATYVNGDAVQVATKHFDPNTGDEVDPSLEIIKISDLQNSSSALKNQAA